MLGAGEVLTVAQMRSADAAGIAAGIAGIELMENAGAAVTEAITARFVRMPAIVLCGPGNNGGDGFVVARRLAQAGWPARVALLGRRERLRGDAAAAAKAWSGDTVPLEPGVLQGAGVAVDALFGAGLTRPIEGVARATIEALKKASLPAVAVDIPSGIDGDTGAILGIAAPARLTVTFHRVKPGHLLLPGRGHVGELVIADIGLPNHLTAQLGVRSWVNRPKLWQALLPRRTADSHKYRHGHALVLGGGTASSGAARMAARAALRAGAGLVTVICHEGALATYAAQLTAVMITPCGDQVGFVRQLEDPRRNAILLGPGGGVGEDLRQRVMAALASGKTCVLDADALTSFADQPSALFAAIEGPCLLTPHEGEFERLFNHEGDKLTRAREAAAESGAVVLLKGADTVVAAPDGRAVVQPDAPASLATAGSGDVLAGVALGLLAQGMPVFEAAAAAVWLHTEAARGLGTGMIAEDLIEALSGPLTELARRPREAPSTSQ
ncbi:MAG TPA: NAD(P)H-hydrate dehydratase [Geminicoccaceae bacterium]|nr:NAD(P)H-hydrate dehydratase [Geminicoccaceae bacterium]